MIGDALKQLFSAKSMTITLICIGAAVFAFMVCCAILVAFNKDIFNHLVELYASIFGGNVTAVGRNVISDGIAPRIPMAIAARTDPSVALGSPTPMTPATPTPGAPTQPSATLAPFVPPGG